MLQDLRLSMGQTTNELIAKVTAYCLRDGKGD
ncbi:hypothetical protein A2U01_0024706, partial [Trifolium medium]|nr:hypothetical protein [Trifolium medium]